MDNDADFGYYDDSQRYDAEIESKDLVKLSPMTFLEYILNHGNPGEMNLLISDYNNNHNFRAYDIAKNCYDNQTLTAKQRLAISNVYIYTEHRYRYDSFIN